MKNNSKRIRSLYLPALCCEMGNWRYFVTSMRLGDVAERIKYAKELRHPERYDEWIQREIQPKRQKQITDYLLNQRERFFSSLVVSVYGGEPKWLDMSLLDTSELRLEDLMPLELAAIDKAIGVLFLNGEEDLFPIDGQHRLSGIREAVQIDPQRKEDIVSVLFVAYRGRIETRRLFSTLNRYAVPINKGERIILDEDDGMAITTRSLIENYPLFRAGRVAPPKRASLAETDPGFTTAYTLYTINTILCTNYFKGSMWKKDLLAGRRRPNDDQLRTIYEIVTRFWDMTVRTFPDVGSVQRQSFQRVISKNRHRKGGNILFRPIGQMALARAVKMLHDRAIDMKTAFDGFRRLPSLELTAIPWNEVLWRIFPDGTGGRMIATAEARNLAATLMLYFGGFMTSKKDIAGLVNKYRKSLGDPRAKLPPLR